MADHSVDGVRPESDDSSGADNRGELNTFQSARDASSIALKWKTERQLEVQLQYLENRR